MSVPIIIWVNRHRSVPVALTAADAKWIYENCGLNTKVKVYEDSTENFDNRLSELTTLAADAKYDPTDQGAVNNAETTSSILKLHI